MFCNKAGRVPATNSCALTQTKMQVGKRLCTAYNKYTQLPGTVCTHTCVYTLHGPSTHSSGKCVYTVQLGYIGGTLREEPQLMVVWACTGKWVGLRVVI